MTPRLHLLLLLAPLACATARPAIVPSVAWPPPPATARLAYRGEIRSGRDVQPPGLWERFQAALAGHGGGHPLQAPLAVAFDPSGQLLVSDADRGEVLVLDLERGRVRTIAPEGPAALRLPVGIDADGAGRIYVADALDRSVRVFSPEGEPVARLDADGALERPSGLAVDRQRGLLYVADAPAHLIRVLRLDGTRAGELGQRGTGPGQFNFPSFLAVGRDGNLYVVDTMNYRVQVLAPDGRFVASVGRHGDGSGDLSAPKGVAVDAAGRIYVADALFDNFQVFDPDGRLLLFVGGHGRGPGEFSMPAGLAVSGTTIAVADRSGGRVELFELLPEPPHSAGVTP
jgi:DNA-binding beta-propeller fold protein YncE